MPLRFVGGVALEAPRAAPPSTSSTAPAPIRSAEAALEAVSGEGGRLAGATARVLDGRAHAGGFAMWGFPGWSIDDGLITARVCDDLLGAAAVLACP